MTIPYNLGFLRLTGHSEEMLQVPVLGHRVPPPNIRHRAMAELPNV